MGLLATSLEPRVYRLDGIFVPHRPMPVPRQHGFGVRAVPDDESVFSRWTHRSRIRALDSYPTADGLNRARPMSPDVSPPPRSPNSPVHTPECPPVPNRERPAVLPPAAAQCRERETIDYDLDNEPLVADSPDILAKGALSPAGG